MQVDNVEMMDQETAMGEVQATGKAFLEALAKWDGEELQGAIISDLIAAHMTTVSRAQLVFQALMNGHCNGEMEMTREGKRFALDFAEMLGPDNAQWLYHFAKFVTKIA